MSLPPPMVSVVEEVTGVAEIWTVEPIAHYLPDGLNCRGGNRSP